MSKYTNIEIEGDVISEKKKKDTIPTDRSW
jgi:hypothetical protein